MTIILANSVMLAQLENQGVILAHTMGRLTPVNLVWISTVLNLAPQADHVKKFVNRVSTLTLKTQDVEPVIVLYRDVVLALILATYVQSVLMGNIYLITNARIAIPHAKPALMQTQIIV